MFLSREARHREHPRKVFVQCLLDMGGGGGKAASRMLLLLALSWLMAGPSSARQVEKPWCYAKEATPYHLLATKTSYFEVDNEDEEPIAVEGKDKFLYEIKLLNTQRSPHL